MLYWRSSKKFWNHYLFDTQMNGCSQKRTVSLKNLLWYNKWRLILLYLWLCVCWNCYDLFLLKWIHNYIYKTRYLQNNSIKVSVCKEKWGLNGWPTILYLMINYLVSPNSYFLILVCFYLGLDYKTCFSRVKSNRKSLSLLGKNVTSNLKLRLAIWRQRILPQLSVSMALHWNFYMTCLFCMKPCYCLYFSHFFTLLEEIHLKNEN